MKILWASWEPGMFNVTKTSGGGARWTSYLFEQFRAAGHEVMWGYTAEQPEGCVRFPIVAADVAIVCWRWELPDTEHYAERNKLYHRQANKLTTLGALKVPTLVHNQDMKMTQREIAKLYDMPNVALAMPAVCPPSPFETLHFPNPYELPLVSGTLGRNRKGIVYVGNNYERYEQTRRVLGGRVDVHPIHFFGNWLEPSPYRQSEEQLKRDFPSVGFGGRVEQALIPDLMRSYRATVHFCKPNYAAAGLVTIRWAEAAASGTIAMLPNEWNGRSKFSEYVNDMQFVQDSRDAECVYELLECDDYYDDVLRAQIGFVKREMTATAWLERIEAMV